MSDQLCAFNVYPERRLHREYRLCQRCGYTQERQWP